jgi:hypothetical protein
MLGQERSAVRRPPVGRKSDMKRKSSDGATHLTCKAATQQDEQAAGGRVRG